MSAVPDDFSARVRTLELASQSNADRLEAHEDICSERYKNIHESIGAIRGDNQRRDRYLMGIGLAALAGLAKLVFFP